MEHVVVHDDRASPVEWAVRREAEGWSGLAMPDHLMTGRRGAWHPFSALGAMAAVTTRVTLMTAYANNLMRSPVEYAQAALSLHRLSSGRFEVGLGAGWARDELVAAGLPYPAARERAERLREAVLIVRDLLHGGCRYDGRHYRVDIAAAGPPAERRPLLSPHSAAPGPSTTSRPCSTGSR